MSMNDPEWGNRGNGGRRPNQGPPDLEELWGDLNRRLAGILGKRGGGGSSGGGGGNRGADIDPKLFGGGVGIVLFLIAAAWAASGFYIVDESQRAVVLRFGKVTEVTDPGLRWRLPFPIESHELVNLSGVRTAEIGYRGSEKNKVLAEALMLTQDENIINIQFAVQWFLKDPLEYVINNRNPDEAVTQAAETAIREIVGKSNMDYVLYEGREQVAQQAAVLMQDILDRYKTGIIVSKFTMQNAQPPEQVQAAFDDAVKAGQDRERQKNEGEGYANDVIPKARGSAARLLEEANAYKQRVVATAEGDASRFRQIYTEYSKAPEVTRKRMYLDTMQEVFANTGKIMLDTKGQGNLLYLPLDQLMRSAGAIAAPESAAAAAANVQEPGVADSVPPRRESLRSRSREGR